MKTSSDRLKKRGLRSRNPPQRMKITPHDWHGGGSTSLIRITNPPLIFAPGGAKNSKGICTPENNCTGACKILIYTLPPLFAVSSDHSSRHIAGRSKNVLVPTDLKNSPFNFHVEAVTPRQNVCGSTENKPKSASLFRALSWSWNNCKFKSWAWKIGLSVVKVKDRFTFEGEFLHPWRWIKC